MTSCISKSFQPPLNTNMTCILPLGGCNLAQILLHVRVIHVNWYIQMFAVDLWTGKRWTHRCNNPHTNSKWHTLGLNLLSRHPMIWSRDYFSTNPLRRIKINFCVFYIFWKVKRSALHWPHHPLESSTIFVMVIGLYLNVFLIILKIIKMERKICAHDYSFYLVGVYISVSIYNSIICQMNNITLHLLTI